MMRSKKVRSVPRQLRMVLADRVAALVPGRAASHSL